MPPSITPWLSVCHSQHGSLDHRPSLVDQQYATGISASIYRCFKEHSEVKSAVSWSHQLQFSACEPPVASDCHVDSADMEISIFEVSSLTMVTRVN